MPQSVVSKIMYEQPRSTVDIETTNDSEILECIRRLERRTRLFATYIFDGVECSDLPEQVLDFMNQSLSEIFTDPLQLLKEKDFAIVAVHAFYCSKELREHQSACSSQMHFIGDLLVCYIMRFMRRIFQTLNELEHVTKYKEHHINVEDNIINKLQKEYQRDDLMCKDYLKTDYSAFQQDSDASIYAFKYPLDIAMLAKCEKVLNHSSSRLLMNERWTPHLSISRIRFTIAFFTVLPIFFLPFDRTTKLNSCAKNAKKHDELLKKPSMQDSSKDSMLRNMDEPDALKSSKILTFYASPCSNFCLHTTFYFIYIFLYATVLLHKPSRFEFRFTDFNLEILLYVCQVSYISEMIQGWITHGYFKFFKINPFDSVHNYLNIAWMFSFMLSTVMHDFPNLAMLRASLLVLSKFFFLISFIFSSLRIIRVFSADSFFGAIVVMVRKMIFTLWSLFIVILIFWFTYAIAMMSMLDQLPATQNVLWSIFSNGAFEIFGAVQDNMRNGEVNNCPSKFNTSDITEFSIDCVFRSWTIPILLFVYVLVSSLLLVNIVTSFFSKTFDLVRETSVITYRYKQYQRLYEYERKCRIPAPLSLIINIFLIFRLFLRIGGDMLSSLCQNRDGMETAHQSPEKVELMNLSRNNRQLESIVVMDKNDNKGAISPSETREVDQIENTKYESSLPEVFRRPCTQDDEDDKAKRTPENSVKRKEMSVKPPRVGLYCGYRRRNRKGRAHMTFVKVKELV